MINIKVPPLRSRKGDIPLLAESFIKSVSEKNNIPPKKISPSLMDKLISLNWPGNVRELENCIERMMVISPDDVLDEDLLPDELEDEGASTRAEAQNYNLSDIEKNVLIEALEKSNWNKSKAAKLLNIDRKALYNRIIKYNISVPNGPLSS